MEDSNPQSKEQSLPKANSQGADIETGVVLRVSPHETRKLLFERVAFAEQPSSSPNHTRLSVRAWYCRPSTYAHIPSRQYLHMNQDKGRIEDVARRKAKNGTPYASVRIDGENYTCWDDALISKLESGQDADYQ